MQIIFCGVVILKAKKFLLYMFMSILSIFLSIFIFLEFKVILYSDLTSPKKADAALILGYSLDYGVLPSNWLVLRLECGLSLYELGYVEKIIVSGGQGPTDNLAVSTSMKKWLLINGVDENDIFTEELAKNTYENFKYSRVIADNNNISSIIIVTNDFHMYRSMLIGNKIFNNLQGYSTKPNFDLNKLLAYLKEPLSIIKYFIFNNKDPVNNYVLSYYR